MQAASIQGDRETLKADAVIPATMALIYLGLLIYFRSIGGYKAVHLEWKEAATAELDRQSPSVVASHSGAGAASHTSGKPGASPESR